MLINAGQTYTINSSYYAFRFGRISLRISTLLLSTSIQSLFLILKYSESFTESFVYSNRYRSAVLTCLREHVPALISMDRCCDSLCGQLCCPGICPGVLACLDRPLLSSCFCFVFNDFASYINVPCPLQLHNPLWRHNAQQTHRIRCRSNPNFISPFLERGGCTLTSPVN